MAHHTHMDPDGNWYSFCWDCGEKYGPAFGSCSCGGLGYPEAEDPFDVEPPSDPPEYDPDFAYDMEKEDRAMEGELPDAVSGREFDRYWEGV